MRMPGSGAMEGLKGDLSISLGDAQFLGECKKSMTKNLKLQAAWLQKIVQEAEAAKRRPALIYSWQRGPIMVAMPKVNFRASFLVPSFPVVSKIAYLLVNEELPAEFSFSFSRFPELGIWQTMKLEGWVHSCWMQEQSG
jgi:hypothetical protein